MWGRQTSAFGGAVGSVLCILSGGCVPATTPDAADAPFVIRNVRRPTGSARTDAGQGCFTGQMGAEEWAGRVAEASVRIDSEGSSGTGSVIADSADASSPHDRILTAAHVVGDGTRISVYSSANEFLGYANVSATASGNVDVAVLTMASSVSPSYDRIEGVELDRVQSPGIVRGTFSEPAAIEHGASGAGVLDAQGRIVGVIVGKDRDVPPEKGTLLGDSYTRVSGGAYRWDSARSANVPERREVRLPARGEAYAAPVSDAGILGVLGRAGEKVSVGRSTSDRRVQVAGYPLTVCVLYKGTMAISSD